MGHPALLSLHNLLLGSEISVKEERGKMVLLAVSVFLSLS